MNPFGGSPLFFAERNLPIRLPPYQYERDLPIIAARKAYAQAKKNATKATGETQSAFESAMQDATKQIKNLQEAKTEEDLYTAIIIAQEALKNLGHTPTQSHSNAAAETPASDLIERALREELRDLGVSEPPFNIAEEKQPHRLRLGSNAAMATPASDPRERTDSFVSVDLGPDTEPPVDAEKGKGRKPFVGDDPGPPTFSNKPPANRETSMGPTRTFQPSSTSRQQTTNNSTVTSDKKKGLVTSALNLFKRRRS